MGDDRKEWLAKRAAAQRAPVGPAVTDCSASARPDGRFDVVLRGRDLDPHAIPPDVRIGDHRVREIHVDREGGALRGVVDQVAAGDPVHVDLGPFGITESTVGEIR